MGVNVKETDDKVVITLEGDYFQKLHSARRAQGIKDLESLIMFLIRVGCSEPGDFLAHKTKDHKTRIILPPKEILVDLTPESQLMLDRVEEEEDLEEKLYFDDVEQCNSFCRRAVMKLKEIKIDKYVEEPEIKNCSPESDDVEDAMALKKAFIDKLNDIAKKQGKNINFI